MTAVKRAAVGTRRLALAKAIESRVEKMDMAALIELATALKIAVPAATKALREREQKPHLRSSSKTSNVLHGRGIGPVISAAEGSRLLDAITIDDDTSDWVESDLLGAGDLVQQLSISRGTLDNWRKANRIIALRKGLRNFLYPFRQFEHRRPLEGLDSVASFFASPEEAWEWLVAPNRMTGGKPPIDTLRDGNVPMVTSAAEGAFDYA